MEKVIKAMRDPRWFVAALWPLVLAVPYLPGIPKPSLGGLAWRQELAFAAILVGTFGLLITRLSKLKDSIVQLEPSASFPTNQPTAIRCLDCRLDLVGGKPVFGSPPRFYLGRLSSLLCAIAPCCCSPTRDASVVLRSRNCGLDPQSLLFDRMVRRRRPR